MNFYEKIECQAQGTTLLVTLKGDWVVSEELPQPVTIEQQILDSNSIDCVVFDPTKLRRWDSSLLTFLISLNETLGNRGIPIDLCTLPNGVRRLIELALAVPERKGARREDVKKSFIEGIGSQAISVGAQSIDSFRFLGEVGIGVGRLLTGKSRFQYTEFFYFVQQCGSQALGIVALISLLIGLILAFVGAIQLQMFGAELFIADLVGIGVVREMGAMMTGIIMAGRTGAAYAAQLGTMQVNEEIDALTTFGISPMEFLVLPRMLALTFMMPLLCLYSDLLGMIGGAMISVGLFDITPTQYYEQTKLAVPLKHLWVGLSKSTIYGIIIALAGCLRGMQCGRSASAVGEATTSAVVTSIVWIIVACAITTVIFYVLGI
jgi:phospholipid/cholesterol/gamma-HCH transport system permease protein